MFLEGTEDFALDFVAWASGLHEVVQRCSLDDVVVRDGEGYAEDIGVGQDDVLSSAPGTPSETFKGTLVASAANVRQIKQIKEIRQTHSGGYVEDSNAVVQVPVMTFWPNLGLFNSFNFLTPESD